jgi:hypothetical protein
MALTINTPIGTDRGLANNAYVRINEYRVLKTGECIFDVHIYKTKEDAIIADSNIATYGKANHLTCTSLEIGKEVRVDLSREIVKTVTIPTETPTTAVVTKTIGSGDRMKSYTVTESSIEIKNNTFETTLKIADWTTLENHNIFEFGYSMLKDKLVQLYGDENVIDDHTIAAGEGPFATELSVDIAARKAGHIDSVPPQS